MYLSDSRKTIITTQQKIYKATVRRSMYPSIPEREDQTPKTNSQTSKHRK